MGTDIHGLIERRVNGKWICWRTLNSITTSERNKYDMNFASPSALDRNYERFKALAGVRDDSADAVMPRGLPEDASDTTRHLFETRGDHTPSWLSLEEAVKIFQSTECNDLREFDKKYPLYYYFGIDSEEGALSDFRLVFWFDS